jgi:hypothetical protein
MMHRRPTTNIPTTCKHQGVDYDNLQLNTHEDSSKIYALSIGNGANGSLNLNTTMAPKRKSQNQRRENNLHSSSHGTMVQGLGLQQGHAS